MQQGGIFVVEQDADVLAGHAGERARLSGGAEEPTHGFSPCAGSEPKLVRHARLLQVWGEVLREHPTNQPSQHVANDECANPAMGADNSPARRALCASEGSVLRGPVSAAAASAD
eukprot:s5492_g9.t1